LYAVSWVGYSHITVCPFFLNAQLKSFNGSLRDVEDSYQQSLQAIEAQYQSRESYSNVLEKEMSAALK
jgi:hypothetical protein